MTSAATKIDEYFANNYGYFGGYEPVGQVIVEEAESTGLELSLACTLVEQESGGRNIFGWITATWVTRRPTADST